MNCMPAARKVLESMRTCSAEGGRQGGGHAADAALIDELFGDCEKPVLLKKKGKKQAAPTAAPAPATSGAAPEAEANVSSAEQVRNLWLVTCDV